MEISEVQSSYNKETEKAIETRSKAQKKETNSNKSAKEYEDYIFNKYNFLQKSENNSVTIAPDLLTKGATDEKTSQWLEYNLNLIPDVMDKIYENAAKNGGKVLSCNISFDGYDSMTTQVHVVSEADPGTEEAKKLLEEARAKNKERREQWEKTLEKNKEEKKAEEEASNIRSMRMVTNNVDSLISKVDDLKFDNQNRVSIDIRG